MISDSNQTSEQKARDNIDAMLFQAGWHVQDRDKIDFTAGPGKTIADPACDTGGFFLTAYDFITNPDNHALDKDQKAFLKHETFTGNEIVANTHRLCLMNIFLHNIGEIDGESMISPNDALIADSGDRVDYVLVNPPFGKKSSMSFTNEEGEQDREDLTYNRQDFWATTSNKQLNFVQHIRTMMKISGTSGMRKVRIAGKGKGKSGGYRIITFFTGSDIPVFLITVYGKGQKANITAAEKKAMKTLSNAIVEIYRSKKDE